MEDGIHPQPAGSRTNEPTSDENGTGVDRRKFVTGAIAAAGAVAAAGALAGGTAHAAPTAPAFHRSAPARRFAAGRRVAVFGGGMGGLATAQELAERGFQVTVYERKAWGGKNRSIPVPDAGTGGRKDLPGEHGFRFFPGFYQNLPDTMSRIPLPGGGNVAQNLEAGKGVERLLQRHQGRPARRGLHPGHAQPESLLKS